MDEVERTAEAERQLVHFLEFNRWLNIGPLKRILSRDETVALLYLGKYKDDFNELTTRDLTRLMGMHEQEKGDIKTAYLIARLLEKGLLVKRENPEDSREHLVSLTDYGLGAYRASRDFLYGNSKDIPIKPNL